MAVMGTFFLGPYQGNKDNPTDDDPRWEPEGGARPPCASLRHQPKGSRVNTEPDKMSYKGIAPIFTWRREPYPDPNALIFDCKIFIFVMS